MSFNLTHLNYDYYVHDELFFYIYMYGTKSKEGAFHKKLLPPILKKVAISVSCYTECDRVNFENGRVEVDCH